MRGQVGSRGYWYVTSPISFGYSDLDCIQVSTPAKDLSEFGKKMRSAVFYELHRIRDDVLVAAERETGRKGSDPATTEKRVEKPAFLATGGEEGRKSRRSFQRR